MLLLLSKPVLGTDSQIKRHTNLGGSREPAARRVRGRGIARALAAAEAARARRLHHPARVKAAEQEAQARQLARSVEDQLGRLRTEARGLAQLTAPRTKSGHAPALDSVSPDKGYGAALAAALGDDLDAALDAKAPSYWGGAEAPAPVWPEGAEPLAPLVKAPPALAARLSHVAVVTRVNGDRLQKELKPGMRLVSKDGDLWRWDGFVARADAPIKGPKGNHEAFLRLRARA